MGSSVCMNKNEEGLVMEHPHFICIHLNGSDIFVQKTVFESCSSGSLREFLRGLLGSL